MSYVVFAPHPDDELIGCYSYLRSGQVSKVFYFYDITEERAKEAIRCAQYFNFKPIFVTDKNDLEISPNETILAPNINDQHIHHKKINKLAKSYPNKKMYYSVDMNVKFDVLLPDNQQDKKALLDGFYPSQRKLFENEKYYLFESIVDDDSNKMIWVTFQRSGLHYYPQALTNNQLIDVNYLGYTHRHLFKFKVSIEVNHSDRDIEFHQFLNWLESLYDTKILELNNMSCEMIADQLIEKIASKYQDRKVIIEVSEDGECGATCEYQI